ncbi:MAG: signal peptidase I, partial [Candidatus Hydrogenedens sp.]
IKDGKIFINGKPLELPPDMPDIYYTSGPVGIGGMEYGIRTEDKYSLIPENCYFVLGDNSAYSRDGRFFGWVPNEHIVGRVSCIWWPPSRWRDFTGFSKTWWWKTLCLLTSIFVIVRLLFARSVVWYTWNTDKLYHYIVNQLSYGLRLPFTKIWLHTWKKPERGDIVAYITPAGVKNISSELVLCGMVVGIEGDKISIQNNTLLINGKELTDTPFPLNNIESSFSNQEAPYGLLKDKEHSIVPAGNVFIIWNFPKKDMEIAIDSRITGWIPESNILGKLIFIWWPPTHWKKL